MGFVIVLLLLVGQAMGQPAGLGYVETGSMEPTMDPGDGFVAIPAAVAGPIESGDVVVFEAQEVQGGGLTTHRIVGESPRGYVTKGDANPVTDQSGGEPPVKRSQIVATALAIDGHLVVIPKLGTAVETVQTTVSAVQRHLAALLGTRAVLGPRGLAFVFFALTMGWYLLSWLLYGSPKERSRDTSRSSGYDPRLAVGVLALLLVLGSTVGMVSMSEEREVDFVSADVDQQGLRVVEAGTSENASYAVQGGLAPTVTFLDTDGQYLDVSTGQLSVWQNGTANATLTVSAPPERGYYRQYVHAHRYFAFLPVPVLHSLYETHPWLPIIAIDALLGGGFYALGRLLIGEGRIRDRRREAGPPSWLPAPIAGLFGRSR